MILSLGVNYRDTLYQKQSSIFCCLMTFFRAMLLVCFSCDFWSFWPIICSGGGCPFVNTDVHDSYGLKVMHGAKIVVSLIFPVGF